VLGNIAEIIKRRLTLASILLFLTFLLSTVASFTLVGVLLGCACTSRRCLFPRPLRADPTVRSFFTIDDNQSSPPPKGGAERLPPCFFFADLAMWDFCKTEISFFFEK
jgi:hypothetical protein